MKYIFDVNTQNDHTDIRIELLASGAFNNSSASKIVSLDDGSNTAIPFNILISDLIDNMRLTVSERHLVRKNAKVLIDYLNQNKYQRQTDQENGNVEMINESYANDNVENKEEQ